VIESNTDQLPVGAIVSGMTGWQEYTVAEARGPLSVALWWTGSSTNPAYGEGGDTCRHHEGDKEKGHKEAAAMKRKPERRSGLRQADLHRRFPAWPTQGCSVRIPEPDHVFSQKSKPSDSLSACSD